MTEDKPKKKRVMTPIMLEHLKQARIKALEVRARLKSSETECKSKKSKEDKVCGREFFRRRRRDRLCKKKERWREKS